MTTVDVITFKKKNSFMKRMFSRMENENSNHFVCSRRISRSARVKTFFVVRTQNMPSVHVNSPYVWGMFSLTDLEFNRGPIGL